MKTQNNVGFTLIELLVVVLIIGILAAIALPQYTKAVERSRMAEAVQVLGDLATAQSIFYMQHNRFANSLTEVNTNGDVTMASNLTQANKWTFVDTNMASGTQAMTRDGGMYSGGQLSLTVNADGSITKTCTAPTSGDNAAQFCGMAATAGYGTSTSSSSSSSGSGGN